MMLYSLRNHCKLCFK